MRRWSSFLHLFLEADQRLRAVADLQEGAVTLWVGAHEPVITIHVEDQRYCRALTDAINIASATRPREPQPPPTAPASSPVSRILRLVKGAR